MRLKEGGNCHDYQKNGVYTRTLPKSIKIAETRIGNPDDVQWYVLNT